MYIKHSVPCTVSNCKGLKCHDLARILMMALAVEQAIVRIKKEETKKDETK